MSLLQNEIYELVDRVILGFEQRLDDALHEVQFAGDGSPVGIHRVSGDEQAVWKRWLEKSARQEQEGFRPGDLASTAAQQPEVREQVIEGG